MSTTNNSGSYLDREGFLGNFIKGQYFIVQAEMSDTWELMKCARRGKKPVGVIALICKTKREREETHFCSFIA